MLYNQISIIILTYNEEKNIEACLQSISSLQCPIFIVDSGSQDKTLAIAQKYNVQIFHHPFENYGAQRNWALQNLPITNPWVLNMDADHRMSNELKTELQQIFQEDVSPTVKGFLISRKTIFMGKWIKYGGHYPTYHAILFRKDSGSCENKLYDQHFVVEGYCAKLKGDMIDILTDSLQSFTLRHNKWSDLEAHDQFFGPQNHEEKKLVQADIQGNALEKRRYIKSIYEKFPLFVRPFIYFFIRYFLKLGFLDGKRGLIFHFLQGFWFRFLIDAKIYELKQIQKDKHAH
ncbi:putative glycosyl transferase [Pedobacter glucosidilyticus]|nr:glycosyltransferase family 2 protein [Pedobacter glucosidilyticus]KHJ36970.1 putative glycosyl transferase [Pedobacter glucosidilyticus]